MCAERSTKAQFFPLTTASFQVLPPSTDTWTLRPEARGIDSVPVIARPALPSAVAESPATPVSLPTLEIFNSSLAEGCWMPICSLDVCEASLLSTTV
ncbi:hypothetical protein FQZ97_835970 [compost metagenome]